MLGISSHQDSAKEKPRTSISLAETDMVMETGNALRGATVEDSLAAPCKGKRATLTNQRPRETKAVSTENCGLVHRSLIPQSQNLGSSRCPLTGEWKACPQHCIWLSHKEELRTARHRAWKALWGAMLWEGARAEGDRLYCLCLEQSGRRDCLSRGQQGELVSDPLSITEDLCTH